MNYRLIRSTKNLSERHRLAYPILFIGLVTTLHFLFPNVLRGIATTVARPVWVAERTLVDAGSAFLGYFSAKSALIDDITKLTTELQHKDIQLLDRDILAEENRILKESFGRGDETKSILGSVLSVPPLSLYDTIVLDAGSLNGVREGAHVYVGPILLGTVVRTTGHTSVAELNSTSGQVTPMRIQHGAVAIPIEAKGRGAGEFTATIPKESDVAVGDSVFLTGIRPTLFGTVDAIDSTITSSFQTIFIISPVHIQALRFVEIVNDDSTIDL
ncbi:MAG: hypothetical protein COV91_02765 [Candidatus Taylorbacteria bacterium CG11_big_fil_rev_8_21_14_0_20_46_11]|uniref:Cell shape-determining protein MreC n=1 Tax=Candidatus Taylorbacteria bacterium CG11_big_fil_rev_8_21_14_0_20_46_11 TaxID=1975025 RepID=A0A2H0KBS8_9BACT|nr:MAG: hypothetical protein COV91_02765 [Candidatus Taylorbacteria bacterium CG11_big_fil_rev_8_21_14_0_20_46_11]